jgi:hypothetical protein
MEEIPTELILPIFGNFGVFDVCVGMFVCRLWYYLLKRISRTRGYWRNDPYLPSYAAIEGRPEMFEWLLSQGAFATSLSRNKVHRNVAKHGHIHILEMLSNQQSLCYEAYVGAIKGNQLEVLEWLWKHNCPDGNYLYEVAIRKGNISMMQWLRNHGFNISKNAFMETAARNNFVMMKLIYKWLYSRVGNYVHATRSAIRNGNLEMLRWLKKHDLLIIDGNIYEAAAEGGHIDVMIRLHEEIQIQIEISSDIFNASARNGHVHILEYLIAQGHVIPNFVIMTAAANGHLNILVWAFDNSGIFGRPLNYVKISKRAARGGYLHILQWMSANDLPQYTKIPTIAAIFGYI